MAQVHCDETEATQEKRQKHRHAVGIVESGDEHEQEQHTEPHAGARWQDVKSAPLQCQRQGIGSLTPSDPGRHPLADEASHWDCRILEGYGDRSNELLSDRLRFAGSRRLATLEAVRDDGGQHRLHIFREHC